MANFRLRYGLFLIWAIGLAAAGCQKNVVVLLPNPDGTVGHITVANSAGSVELGTANTATAIRDAETAPSLPATMDSQNIKALFEDVLGLFQDLRSLPRCPRKSTPASGAFYPLF